jgi:hypothetical protein
MALWSRERRELSKGMKMSRNLKIFALALMGAVLTSAMAAHLAQADLPASFTTAKTQETTDSDALGAEVFGMPGGRTFTCEGVTGAGVLSGPVNEEEHIETEELAITPSFSGCHAKILGIERPGTVAMNGCSFGYKATKDKSGAYTALMTVICPGSNQIEVKVYESAAKHSEGKAVCTYTISGTENQNLAGIELTNNAGPPKDITADFDMKNLHDVVDGGALLCGTSSGEATLKAKETWRATDKNNKYVDLLVSG